MRMHIAYTTAVSVAARFYGPQHVRTRRNKRNRNRQKGWFIQQGDGGEYICVGSHTWEEYGENRRGNYIRLLQQQQFYSLYNDDAASDLRMQVGMDPRWTQHVEGTTEKRTIVPAATKRTTILYSSNCEESRRTPINRRSLFRFFSKTTTRKHLCCKALKCRRKPTIIHAFATRLTGTMPKPCIPTHSDTM